MILKCSSRKRDLHDIDDPASQSLWNGKTKLGKASWKNIPLYHEPIHHLLMRGYFFGRKAFSSNLCFTCTGKIVNRGFISDLLKSAGTVWVGEIMEYPVSRRYPFLLRYHKQFPRLTHSDAKFFANIASRIDPAITTVVTFVCLNHLQTIPMAMGQKWTSK